MTNEYQKLVWAVKNGDLDEVKKIINLENININAEIEGRSLIHYAADYNQIEILSYLIEKGANVNSVDKYGMTALLAAIYESHTECVRVLLSCNADKNGRTPDNKTYLEVAENAEIKSLLV